MPMPVHVRHGCSLNIMTWEMKAAPACALTVTSTEQVKAFLLHIQAASASMPMRTLFQCYTKLLPCELRIYCSSLET